MLKDQGEPTFKLYRFQSIQYSPPIAFKCGAVLPPSVMVVSRSHLARVEEIKQVVKVMGVDPSQVEKRARLTDSSCAKNPFKETAARGQD